MNFDVSTMNCLGSWRVERCWLQFPPLSCHTSGVLKIFLERPTTALLLHRICHVAQCVYILTKALPLFTLLLKIAYLGFMVGKKESCTCVTCIAKSNNGSMEMTNQTNWSRLCSYVEGGWWKWNTPFTNLSLLYLDNMRTWLYYCFLLLFLFFFFSWTLMCPFFLFYFFGSCFLGMPSFFFDSPFLIWKILERERDH